MLELQIYTPQFKTKWDDLIRNSRNGTFLFYRDYMDYHSNRFKDFSFLILKKGCVEAVLPGNVVNDVYYSHQGLTYGGLISSSSLTTIEINEIFVLLNCTLKDSGIREVIYKPVPYVYHCMPSQEDIYILFKLRASKIGCNISTSIYQNNKRKFSELRRRGIKKSQREGVSVTESDDFATYWSILNNNLQQKHKTQPVHTLKEIMYLKSLFPENIKLFTASQNGQMVAGIVIYEMKHVVHVQYISANEKGKEISALDLLFDELINRVYVEVPVFDFGQSTENMGNYLNENLMFQKEGFGGRGIVYDIYQYTL
ncbi:MAG: GNAT family N-acetyltransferase [Bacteroidetes bacterium]|nr:GNAT family N-acetyltransferase [Bacteroidota bacterium]